MTKKLIILAGRGVSTTLMFNGIQSNFPIHSVILEENVNRKEFLKKRIKKLGLLKVGGQILFQLFFVPILLKKSQGRIYEIKKSLKLDDAPIPQALIKYVPSVNSIECIDYLKKENPDLIIVNGTRIISKKVLNNINSTFINTHVGITPKYRGVHGAYWALVNKDNENCGVTIHKIDEGIDTGGVLHQEIISPTAKDNFTTYPYLQIAKGIDCMRFVISEFLEGNLLVVESKTKESRLWTHPTIWSYIYNWIKYRVK